MNTSVAARAVTLPALRSVSVIGRVVHLLSDCSMLGPRRLSLLRLLTLTMRLTNVMVVAALLAVPVAGRADSCPPTAVIGGPPALAAPLTRALVSRGVQIEPAGIPAGPCPSLNVDVVAAPEGLRVTITDPWGRRAERALANVLTAATLIEAWARMDLLQGVATSSTGAAPVAPLTPVAPLSSSAPAVAPEAAPAVATTEAAAPVPADTPEEAAPAAGDAVLDSAAPEASLSLLEPESTRLLIDATGELGVSRTRSVWAGTAVTACVRLGAVCLGGLGRFAMSRGEVRFDGLGLVALPITLGRLTLQPAVGAGVGAELERRGRGRGRGDFADFGGPDGDARFRAEVRLDLSYRFSDSFHALLGASASAAPDLGRGGSLLGPSDQTMVRGHVGLMWGVP